MKLCVVITLYHLFSCCMCISCSSVCEWWPVGSRQEPQPPEAQSAYREVEWASANLKQSSQLDIWWWLGSCV